MTTNYNGDSTSFPVTAALPSDGDDAVAESVDASFRNLLDRTAWLRRALLCNWTKQAAVAGASLFTVCSNQLPYGTRYWIVAGDGVIYKSTNGLAWTSETPGSSYSGNFNNSVYIGAVGGIQRILLVGDAGEIQAPANNAYNTWTRYHGGEAFALLGVAWDGTHAVAVGENGAILRCTPATSLGSWATSTPAAAYAGDFNGIAFGAGVFVAVGENGEIQTSPDGITFTHRTAAGGFTGLFTDVTYAGAQFVAVGANGEVQTSPNGITWTRRTLTDAIADAFGCVITYAFNQYVLCGKSTGQARISVDGITWDSIGAGPNAAAGTGIHGIDFDGFGTVMAVRSGDVFTSLRGN